MPVCYELIEKHKIITGKTYILKIFEIFLLFNVIPTPFLNIFHFLQLIYLFQHRECLKYNFREKYSHDFAILHRSEIWRLLIFFQIWEQMVIAWCEILRVCRMLEYGPLKAQEIILSFLHWMRPCIVMDEGLGTFVTGSGFSWAFVPNGYAEIAKNSTIRACCYCGIPLQNPFSVTEQHSRSFAIKISSQPQQN